MADWDLSPRCAPACVLEHCSLPWASREILSSAQRGVVPSGSTLCPVLAEQGWPCER